MNFYRDVLPRLVLKYLKSMSFETRKPHNISVVSSGRGSPIPPRIRRIKIPKYGKCSISPESPDMSDYEISPSSLMRFFPVKNLLTDLCQYYIRN